MKSFKRFIALFLLVMLALPGGMNVSAKEVDSTEECSELHEHEIAEEGLSIQTLSTSTCYHPTPVSSYDTTYKSGCTYYTVHVIQCGKCGIILSSQKISASVSHDFPSIIWSINGPYVQVVKCKNCDALLTAYNPLQ